MTCSRSQHSNHLVGRLEPLLSAVQGKHSNQNLVAQTHKHIASLRLNTRRTVIEEQPNCSSYGPTIEKYNTYKQQSYLLNIYEVIKY